MCEKNRQAEGIMSNTYDDETVKIFSLNGNLPLAEKIANAFGKKLGKSVVKTFADGNIVSELLYNRIQVRKRYHLCDIVQNAFAVFKRRTAILAIASPNNI